MFGALGLAGILWFGGRAIAEGVQHEVGFQDDAAVAGLGVVALGVGLVMTKVAEEHGADMQNRLDASRN